MASASSEAVSLRDAVCNVELLEQLIVPDDQPCIESRAPTVACHVSFDTNFEDKNAYVLGISKYMEEAARHGEFNSMLIEGQQHAANLYTWRCCTRTVPMVKSNDQANRMEINARVADVLRPEVDKLAAFMNFTHKAVVFFCSDVRRLCHPEKRKDFVSEAYLLTLGKFLNMFAVLDELKNMKASIKNDYSTFRRAAQLLAGESQYLQDLQALSMFLATQNSIRSGLKRDLEAIEAFDELLVDVVNICAHLYEEKMYATPAERHAFIKTLGFSINLMGHDALVRLDAKKRVSISRLDRIFKGVDVVPLYGDMPILPFSFVRQSEGYEASRWPLSSQETEKCRIDLVDRLATIRAHHESYVTQLAKLSTEVAVYNRQPSCEAEWRDMASLALSGVQLLCQWTSDVVETVSWKLHHPASPRTHPNCPETAEDYERATKYNYSPAEKTALVEVISMIKAVQALLIKMEPSFTTAIRKHVYADLQSFVQLTLREPLQKALKAKKDIVATILQSVVDTCADTYTTSGTSESRASSLNESSKSTGGKSKKSAATGTGSSSSQCDLRVPTRVVAPAPSSTQLYLTRTMLESLVSERSAGGRRVLRKELDPKHVEKIAHFLRISFHWSHLFRLSTTLQECCDLGQLWFREFYLEMTNGTRIQFPIEMSIPWILTDHILTSQKHSPTLPDTIPQEPALMECSFYQLDLYNDAAHYSLHSFRKQFLYDEVEAEVNLVFDQFIFKLSDAVFAHYKQLAACQLLDKRFKLECARAGVTIRTPPAVRFDSILKQRHVQLLGRSVDVQRLVAQRIHIALLRSIDSALSRFEAEPLSAIVELDAQLEVNRLCHRLLRKHLASLADFDDLLLEANHAVSSPHSRITHHVFWELNYDLVPSHNFNSSTHRFVRTGRPIRETPARERFDPPEPALMWGSRSLNAAFANIFHLYAGFIGQPHLRAIAKLLKYQGLSAVLDELYRMAQLLVGERVRLHAHNIFNQMPKVCKLPRPDYGSSGVLQYYMHHLDSVGKYPALRGEFMQELRELGNILVFVQQIEQAMAAEEATDLLHSAAFTNVIPKPPATNVAEQARELARLEEKYARIHVAAVVERSNAQPQAPSQLPPADADLQIRLARDSELLTKERLCCGLDLFGSLLLRLQELLRQDQIWATGVAGRPANGVLWVDECAEWRSLWSAVQFWMAMPTGNFQAAAEQQPLAEELFGDGPQWAALALLVLLGQQRRFELLDYSYHLYKIQKHDQKADVVHGVSVARMADRIRRLQLLNNHIIWVLTQQLGDDGPQPVECVREFAPPQRVPQQVQPQQ